MGTDFFKMSGGLDINQKEKESNKDMGDNVICPMCSDGINVDNLLLKGSKNLLVIACPLCKKILQINARFKT